MWLGPQALVSVDLQATLLFLLLSGQSQECHDGHPPWGHTRPRSCPGHTEPSAGPAGGLLDSVRPLTLLFLWPGVLFPLLSTQKSLLPPAVQPLCRGKVAPSLGLTMGPSTSLSITSLIPLSSLFSPSL